jgi:hypothetical protein
VLVAISNIKYVREEKKKGEIKICCKIIFQTLTNYSKLMKDILGKMQIKYFYQGYFNHDNNSKQLII